MGKVGDASGERAAPSFLSAAQLAGVALYKLQVSGRPRDHPKLATSGHTSPYIYIQTVSIWTEGASIDLSLG